MFIFRLVVISFITPDKGHYLVIIPVKYYQVQYPISPGQQYHNLEFAPNPGVNEIPLFITSIAILFALTLVGQLIERGEIQDE